MYDTFVRRKFQLDDVVATRMSVDCRDKFSTGENYLCFDSIRTSPSNGFTVTGVVHLFKVEAVNQRL